ncbi:MULTISPECIES: LysR family transcriptional regulator [unclassified Janthinobacterium]|uniref:LysR substrate-binding domain-containing protein n=1 Tax=unclassified Janthinobacterium TaxID=2610881 RepID=UPI00161EC817|nr:MULTISPECIES: LysR family transcriptional regulator [unclassified Janthinobacterium]MBB5368831.1 LysR family transcriptional regulator for bpeEF and oprC [Janthinobacterium sp. K2C7]MBB5381633.1 LysR family transcriptional regulator for bpeEF and oprC [Janthinobacterium sp. K2Li3]MBB5387213.1 LysR family transcriptional regulator for bpeEF and oprC [Janthinobacterium sp. K2E3]
MNKLQAMEVFIQVVDAGGFTRAAENMQLPKATVSTLIQSLEASLSVKLLNRTTRHVSITSDGAAYYERCVRILSDVREAEESLSRTRLSPSGRLRVDAPTALASELLIPALPDFFARYPDIVLELGCSDRPVDLIEEGVDCAVRGGELGDLNLIARRVGQLHFMTCASPAYLAQHGTPTHPNDLTAHRGVNFFSAKTGKTFEWDFTRDGERIQIAMNSHIALNDSNAYTAAGLAGLGVIQMTHFMLEPLKQQGRMIELLEDWHSDPLPIHVIYPPNRHLSAKVRVFVEWVADMFSTHPATQLKNKHARPELPETQP